MNVGMNKKALFEQIGGIMHGGDYNPEQWLDRPDILEQDIVLMKKIREKELVNLILQIILSKHTNL